MEELISTKYLRIVIRTVWLASKHYENKCIVEENFISYMRKKSHNILGKQYENGKDFDELPSDILYEPSAKKVTKALLKVEATKFNLHNKTQMNVEQDLFADILQSITKYGFDYNFFKDDTCDVPIEHPKKFLDEGGKTYCFVSILQGKWMFQNTIQQLQDIRKLHQKNRNTRWR